MKNKAFECENSILHRRLFEAGQTNQNNKICMRTLNTQLEELPKLKDAITDYQTICAGQQETLENEKKERALAALSLSHKFKHHEDTERALKQKRAHVRKLLSLLDNIDLSKYVNSDDNAGISTICLERDCMRARLEQSNVKTTSLQQELQSVKDNLQQKRLLRKDLSGNLKVEPGHASISPVSESDEELLRRRKRMRN